MKESIFIIIILFFSTSSGGLPLISSFRKVATISGDPLVQIVWSLLYLITFILLLLNWHMIRPHIFQNIPLLFLTGLACLSCIWSINPELSMRRSVALLGTTTVGFYLGTRCSIYQLLKLTIYALIFCAATSILVVLFLPDIGLQPYQGEYVWRGIYGHKNHFGRIMFFAVLISFILSIQKKPRIRTLLFFLSMAFAGLLLASKSTTAIIILCISLSFLPIFIFKQIDPNLKGLYFSIGIGVMVALLVIIFNLSVISINNIFQQSLGKDLTMTGRTQIWGICWQYIKNKFLIGYGYNAFWLSPLGPAETIRYMLNINIAHGHNGFIDLLLQLGSSGLILFLIVLSQYISRAIESYKNRFKLQKCEYFFPIIFFICFFGLNIVESMILEKNYFFWILFIALMVSMKQMSSNQNR